jgi:hypothetical protein
VERKLLLTTLIFLAVACGRGVNENSSSITIRAPTSLRPAGVGTLVALPTNRTACYGINVKGAGSATVGNSCSPETGLLAGFVTSGQDIKAAVPKGLTISIELILFLAPIGQTTCPALVPAFALDQLGSMYIVGTASNISTSENDTVVTIDATFPGLTQNIAEQLSMSPTCRAAARESIPNPNSISAGAQTLSGTGVVMSARAGKPAQAIELTGTNVRMIVR